MFIAETSVVCNDLGVQVDNLRVELAKQIKLTEMKESQLVSLAAKVASLEKEENRGDSDGQSAKLPPVSTNKRRTKASAAPSVSYFNV